MKAAWHSRVTVARFNRLQTLSLVAVVDSNFVTP
jgi:hypothetical protein